jgi:polyphosphate kinase 2 (PPK2 family)
MTKAYPSLKDLLAANNFPSDNSPNPEKELEKLQLKMLRVQQGVWHRKRRSIILFEGFDASGKGGAIRRLTSTLDPRSVRVNSFGPPSAEEQGRHYLYRFWMALPTPGNIAVFDRSWYGRVLVERVEKLTSKDRWSQAYEEIHRMEKMLVDDDIDLVKIFLAISPEEQLRRFEQRLKDPYKQWKITPEDIQARRHWGDYVEAAEEMLEKTHSPHAPWNLVAANHKHYARKRVLEIATTALKYHADWMEKETVNREVKELEKSLKQLESENKNK